MRGSANHIHFFELVLEPFAVIREVLIHVEVFIKGHHQELVLRLHQVNEHARRSHSREKRGRSPRSILESHGKSHARALVDEDSETDGSLRVLREFNNLPASTVLLQNEILAHQTAHKLSR